MFSSKVIPHLCLLRRATFAIQIHGTNLNGHAPPGFPAFCSSLHQKLRTYVTAPDNTASPRWVRLEPELEEALVPRKLSVSPLESWLSLRYSLPPPLEATQPQEDVELLEEKMLPPISVPVLEDETGSATSIQCRNVIKIRRRKMNRHKYKKLQKRIKFLRRKVLVSRRKKKQKRFEEDLKRIWTRAGLKKAPQGWHTPKVFVKVYSAKRR